MTAMPKKNNDTEKKAKKAKEEKVAKPSSKKAAVKPEKKSKPAPAPAPVAAPALAPAPVAAPPAPAQAAAATKPAAAEKPKLNLPKKPAQIKRAAITITVGADAHSFVDPNICRGCGICAADCPTGAMQLGGFSDAEVLAVAKATPGMAGRDLRDVCSQAERRWASLIIRGQAAHGQLPPLAEYLSAAEQRLLEARGGM